ncbi:SDR family NAD(P)-dependent oxidoreductase [Natrinema salaciae]|uniref:NAD(P)-dependent dehydrogenase, short-chain alcohol dehydrogenase family n=1 Tax=Natrinema salaciae TaxID=1186196 RepID=A0A1H9NVG0_9EURY|nr:SDR family NAD(P)-dependent oxidoreductase [Natrinema salaciae]SER39898.1 NAD(P)-dependent dehydrogenase, short-chain alcohol dehydrogenase family [Natrinema salaciae]
MDDTTVIVTGSSTGIGNAIATRFASEGANVVTNSRDAARAEAAAEELTDAGGTAIGIGADVRDRDDVQALVDGAVEAFGSLDVMVNNAGHTVVDPALEMDPDDWRRVIDVNLTGVFFGMQAAGQQLVEQGTGGQIVTISSMIGEQGFAQRAPYCASKAGVNNLTRVFATELAEHDIHVNALAPGFVRTDITDQTQDAAGYTDDDVRRRTPLGRFGTMEEIANCVCFLASGDHYVTGAVLRADGGWLANAWGPET